MSSRANRGMGMGMEKTGLGVDLLEELLARHRRREHAERALGGLTVARLACCMRAFVVSFMAIRTTSH